ncbi:MAG: serine hydrolase [Bacteroidetes bacterium]|nr:serine hydrolase [Bacteroidota bacterium]
MKKIFSVFASLLLLLPAFSQNDIPPSFLKDSLDSYITNAIKEWQIPGVAVCVVKDGKVVVMKGYGVKETGTDDRVDENTLFMIGSNTKAFTATALAMLETENLPAGLSADKAGKTEKFSLDDRVQKWLPGFKLYDPWVANEANIRDLLCHRLGFETFQGDFMFFDSDLTAQQVFEKFAQVKPLYSFRSKWGYTNAAFGVAGEVVSNVSGKTWAEFITEKIFLPLGMNNSLALSKDIKTATNKATAHTVVMGELRKIPYGNIDNISPAGSISSSVNDMSKWVLMLLNNGKQEGKQVIPAAALRQTWLPHSILGNGGAMFNRGHFSLYGLGWMLEEYEGRKIISHTGGVNGFVTSVTLVPEEHLGIIVLTNTDANSFYEALKLELRDAYLGLPYRNYQKVALGMHKADEAAKEKQYKSARDTVAMNLKTSLPLTAYAGEYMHNVYGKMNIKMEEGKLIMRFEHHKGRYGTLEPLGGNRFFCTYSDPLYGMKKLEFTTAGNKVKSIAVRVADFVEFTPYEFVKIK